MSEKVARALGASVSTEPWIVNGKSASIKPVGIKYLTEIQRECLRKFRRSYLENYKESMDLLGKTQADLEAKVDEVGKWDLESLPFKDAYDPKTLVITEDLKSWIEEEILDEPMETPENEEETKKQTKRIQRVTASALDGGFLKPETYEKLTGKAPEKERINYVSWWITGTMEGMIELAYASIRDQGITKEDVYAELGSNFAKLADLSREIESVTRPQEPDPAKNEDSPKGK